MVDFANKVSAVKLQDSVTKSQMFMASIDKQFTKATSFSEVLSGDLTAVDNDIMDVAFDDTMKSVFAFDYTKKAMSANAEAFFRSPANLGASIAKGVETVSNLPISFGFILPFGRFMNNVIFYSVSLESYNRCYVLWPQYLQVKRLRLLKSIQEVLLEEWLLKLASDYQAQQEKKGYAWNEMKQEVVTLLT